jgi:hypothetical protein
MGLGKLTLARKRKQLMPITDTAFRAALIAGSAALALLAGLSARAQDAAAPDAQPIAVPLPGFADPFGKTPILGYDTNRSYIRLANMRDEGIVTNYIQIYGVDEEQVIGTLQVDVPAKASLQIQPHLMLETFAPVNWRQPVVMYVENGREKQLWQHVKFDWRTAQISDASVCTNSPHADYIPARQIVLNAQINRVGYITSRITIHNFADIPGIFEARIYDAGTGQSLGQVEIPLAARESFTESGLWYFDQSDLVYIQPPEIPGSINIEFVPKAPDTGARVVVAHMLHNYETDEEVNLSNPCALTGGTITLPPEGQPQDASE